MAENATAQRSGDTESTAGSPFVAPQINLPKGGGAIRGIDEKFTANPATGTGALSVAIPVSPGRSGFGPQLSLAYDSGSGNGIFGIGWSLGQPSITRRTDKGVPRYHDSEESDIFVLSGAEDLVPVLVRDDDGRWTAEEFVRENHRVRRYRPRVEGLFARIERWTSLETGEAHWRSISKDNVLTVYGLDGHARVADPQRPDRVFSWLICRSYDDKGNAILYEYAAENDENIDTARPSEGNRVRTANRYPKRIRYGNRAPLLLDPERPSFRRSHLEPHDLEAVDWMFEVVFDYGEGHYRAEIDDEGRELAHAHVDPVEKWTVRRDPFSFHRAAFEMRTYRLCRRVMMFHHFPEELGQDAYLVRSTAFQYHEKSIGSFLTDVVQSGHKLQDNGRYLTRSLPPMELSYSTSPLEDADVQDYTVEEIDLHSLANLPGGVDGGTYRWLDLDGEGVAGVLTEQGAGWFYVPNRGDGRFGPAETVRTRPTIAALSDTTQLLTDVVGDGNIDLVDLSVSAAGFHERTADTNWEGFRAFRSFPARDWSDPNLRFVDLSGDGVADVLLTEDQALTWHPSLREDGFGPGLRIPMAEDENAGPRVVFADATESIYLADMSGDGLSDIVRIRNGEICYWPNLGYGRFGAKVVTENAPRFDEPDLFDQRRVRLADTDGSGTADILYLRADGIDVYLNEIGNSWSRHRSIREIPANDDVSSVTVTDLLGHGTACIVWSSPLPRETGRQMRYVDLMKGQKPHLLKSAANNLGAETRIEYTSSTEFYLADKAAGTPWVTKLPFPVHVVTRVETYDYVSRNRFVTRYSYHHGFYDGMEREFRGFGRVDQLDTEEFATLSASGDLPIGVNVDAASHVPPVLTKTWFHTGSYFHGERVSRHLADEYYREGSGASGEAPLSQEQIDALLLDDTILPAGLTAEEAREACRSLKGSKLRQEVYANDGKEDSRRPYTVTENNYTIRTLQRRGRNRHAVFFTHARETLTFTYERMLYDIDRRRHADPRASHSLTLRVDEYGNVLKSASAAYGRRFPSQAPLLTSADRAVQAQLHMTLLDNTYTNAVNEAAAYRAPLPSESRLYELVNLVPARRLPSVTNVFRFAELVEAVRRVDEGTHDLPSEDWQASGATAGQQYRRLLKQSRIVYRSNRLDRLLPLGIVESMALPGESYKLAFTETLLRVIYARRRVDGSLELLIPDPAAVLGSREADGGGYVDLDGDGKWWIPAGKVFLHPNPGVDPALERAEALEHFFTPRRFEDPFGVGTAVDLDRDDLLPARTVDALGNTVSVENDYRVLQPKLVTDPNGNRSAVVFDALGLVVGSAVMGKTSEKAGDSLEGFRTDLSQAEIDEIFHDPRGRAATALLASATTRILHDPNRFYGAQRRTRDANDQQPVWAATWARETHASDLAPGQQTKVQVALTYSDGFGREIQRKSQAPAATAPDGTTPGEPRWICTGWTVFNNKGNPVRRYEPFFDDTHRFTFATKVGVSPILFYDAVGRTVGTLNPNHTFQKIVFDPWAQQTWDVNDTLLVTDPAADPDVGPFFRPLPESDYVPTWYGDRISGSLGHEQLAAATKTAVHANTPGLAQSDSLGRVFLTAVHNRHIPVDRRQDTPTDEFHLTRGRFDIEGRQREIIDPAGRLVMRYDFDLTGTRLHQTAMEAGERWVLNDVMGKEIRTWDSRFQLLRSSYDTLRRPTGACLSTPDVSERQVGRIAYGEARADAAADNVRGKVVQIFDQAGIVTTDRYDFKGNLLRSERQLAVAYSDTLDWSTEVSLESDRYTNQSSYDALNRPIAVVSPDATIIRPTYDESNLLVAVEANLRGAPETTVFVKRIAYNAKSQRTRIEHGNGATTQYFYDPLTFRLIRILTTRGASASRRDSSEVTASTGTGTAVQHLHYTHDPVGNIVHIRDEAQHGLYFRNHRVDPSNDYSYDAAYRLIASTGREHLGQLGGQPNPHSWTDAPRVGLVHPGDGNAMSRYTERYSYDAAGNLTRMHHHVNVAHSSGWTRRFTYSEPSQLEPGKTSNRLTSSKVAGVTDTFSRDGDGYDPDGNLLRMPHLRIMQWDFKDQLRMTQQQAVVGDDGNGAKQHERTWYVYDSTGQRVRKVTERVGQNGSTHTRMHERIYLGVFEIYREYHDGQSVGLERSTLHVMAEKQRVALVDTRTHGGDSPTRLIRFQFGNHLGSAILELDDRAQIISYEEYTAYGNTSYQAVRSGIESPKLYRYAGKERDSENGFYYHGARYCASWLARWINPDPKGMVDGTNAYLYVRDNPLSYTDSTGTQCDPTTQSCVDPAAPTAREEKEQRSIPEEHPSTSATSTSDATAPAPTPTKDSSDEPSASSGFTVRGRDGQLRNFATYEEASAFVGGENEKVGAWERFKEWVNAPDPFSSGDRIGTPGLVTVGAAGVALTGTGAVIASGLARLAPYARVAAVASTPFLVKNSDDVEGMANVATIASFGESGPAKGLLADAAATTRAEEVATEFYNITTPQIQRTLSSPRLPVTFSAVTREGVTVININNPKVYKAFLEATEEGTVVLRPGEFVGSPPIRSGTVPHPDWNSAFLHAETQGELELAEIFDLRGPGAASSFPNPGCGWCVPWLQGRAVVHLNPTHPH